MKEVSGVDEDLGHEGGRGDCDGQGLPEHQWEQELLQSLVVSLGILVINSSTVDWWLGGGQGIPWAHAPLAWWGQHSSGCGAGAKELLPKLGPRGDCPALVAVPNLGLEHRHSWRPQLLRGSIEQVIVTALRYQGVFK